MGFCIGSITEDGRYAPNGNRARKGEATMLEFGQYVVALAKSKGVLELLRERSNPRDADQIYAFSLINCVNGMQPIKNAGRHFAMSALSLRFPGVKTDPDVLSDTSRLAWAQAESGLSFDRLVCVFRAKVAVDGHVMLSSCLNDLAEPGYKHSRLGSDQVNLLMTYDVETARPMLARMYEGTVIDKACVRDLLSRAGLTNKMFIADAGFYNKANTRRSRRTADPT